MNQSQLEQIEARLRAGDPGPTTCSHIGTLPKRIRCFRSIKTGEHDVQVPVFISLAVTGDDLPIMLRRKITADLDEASSFEKRGLFRDAAERMFDAFTAIALHRAQRIGVLPESVATALSHWRDLRWSIALPSGMGHAATETEPIIAAGIERDEMPKGYPDLLAAAPRDIGALCKEVRAGMAREAEMRSQIAMLTGQCDRLRAEAATAKVRLDRAVTACKELVAAAES